MKSVKGSKGCFTHDSMVLTPLGYVNITLLKVGDTVTSFDCNGDYCESKISSIHRYQNERIGKYRTWGGRHVGSTPSHWALNHFNSFAPIGSFEIGQTGLIDENNHIVHIESVEYSEEPVIGIKLDSVFTLVINGIRFHNGALGESKVDQYVSGSKGSEKDDGGRAAIEQPNTLRSVSKVNIIDAVSEGEIVGLGENPLQKVFLSGTPIQNSDGSNNFEGISVVERVGTEFQDYISGFSSSENEVSVGVEVTKSSPVVRSISNNELDAIRVKVQLDSLVEFVEDTGDRQGTSVRIQIQIAPDGGAYSTVIDDTISGKTVTTYERDYRVPLPSGGAPWLVRMVRITNDSTTSNISNATYFGSYTEIIDAKIRYSDTAVYGISVDAELFSESIPSRTYLIEGLIINVPSNYDAETREYSGFWDGTFKRSYSNNPAWVFYDLITNNRYGLGDKIRPDQVDSASLYSIAQYCDELVDDGFGGLEPRFTINVAITTQEEAYAVLNTVASSFRAMPYWANSEITIGQDSPKEPAKIVGPANVIGGTFNYTGTAKKARHSRALVSYLDPEDNYRVSVVTVENSEMIARYGNRDISVTAFGCTSIGQATRHGKWLLDTEQYETEVVSYTAGFDHSDVYPNDIISINDPSYQGIRYAGRLKANSLNEVVLDSEVSFVTTESYQLSLVLKDGSIHSSPIVVDSDFTSNTVIIDTPMPEIPIDGSMWSIAAGENNPRLFRVLTSTQSDDGSQYEISALYYDPDKYDRVEKGLIVDPKSFTGLTTGQPLAPTQIAIQEFLYKSNSGVLSAASISWNQPPDERVVSFVLQAESPSSGGFKTVYSGSDLTYDLQNTQEGEYTFRVQSADAIGRKSAYLTNSYRLQGLSEPPSDVQNFTIDINNGQANLNWDTPLDLDLNSFVIKHYSEPTGATWGNSIVIAKSISATTNNITVPSSKGTYLIKAVDTSGVQSVNAALIVNSADDLSNYNVVEETNEEPLFEGVKESCIVLDGRLRLESQSVMNDWPSWNDIQNLYYGVGPIVPSGIYYFDNDIDLGSIFTSRLSARLLADGDNVSNVMNSWENWNAVETLNGTESSQWSAMIQLRTSDEEAATTSNWSEWSEARVADYTARSFQFRAILSSSAVNITPVVSRLGVVIDMPDRVSGDDDIICPAGGLSVSYVDGSFNAKPALSPSGESMQVGDQMIVTNKTKHGFDIEFKDSNDNSIERTFDYIAKGYGFAQ